jgi:hypothetical protein
MERDEDAGWSNPKVLAIFGIIFLCGAMFGAVGMREFMHTRISRTYVHTIEKARLMPPTELANKLKLTPDQQKAISAQLDEYGKYYQNIEEERADVARHGIDAMRQCLTDDQRRLFDQMFDTKR